MKTTKLFTALAIAAGLFQTASAQVNLTFMGNLINTGGAPVTITFEEANTNNVYPATSDAAGNFSTSFTTTTNQGTILFSFTDCNGHFTLDTIPFTMADSTFLTIDYCPNTPPPPTTCQAYFSASQALDANGVAIGSQLIVTDSSSTSGTGNLTYSWDFGDNTLGSGSVLSHTYSGNGPYMLCLTISDSSGCTDTYCDTISVDSLGMIEAEGFTVSIGVEPTLAIKKTDFSSAVNIFPNPATNFINIEFNTGDKALNRVTMIDLSGKVVFEENNTNSSNNITIINTENIAPGTYLIQMLFDNEIHNEKVIIK